MHLPTLACKLCDSGDIYWSVTGLSEASRSDSGTVNVLSLQLVNEGTGLLRIKDPPKFRIKLGFPSTLLVL